MSGKYQIGDKFIISIEGLRYNAYTHLYDYVSDNGYIFTEMFFGTLKRLEEFDPDEEANADFDAGYAEGLRELWGAIETGDEMSKEERLKYLGHCYLRDLRENGIGPEGFVTGIRKYKEAQEADREIRIGDEVDPLGDKKSRFFVTRIINDRLSGTASDGRWAACDKREARKTGRHFPQIAEVLEAMKTDDHTDTD